jgi:hypothetical protein
MTITAFVVMAVVGGAVGLIELLSHDRAVEGPTGCATGPTGSAGAVVCLNFSPSPTGS